LTAIGRSVRRVEDRRLITGAGCYVADVARPGQLWARIIRSTVAHARLSEVHLDEVRARPDVVGAFSAADLPEAFAAFRIPLRVVPQGEPGFTTDATQPVLATERVRYVGEPVAVVVATDPYAAEDAEEAVWVDFDELEPVLDAERALEAETLLHDSVGSNLIGQLNFTNEVDVDALFERADVVVKERFSSHRHAATPMETRGLVADYDKDSGRLTVWGPTKVKHYNRKVLAELLGLPAERIRFVETDVGGGFGARGELYPEDLLVPWLAFELKRPVKWVEDRGEALVAMNHSREQSFEVEMAATADGQLLAFRSKNWCNMGAYLRTNGPVPPWLGALNFAGPYHWEGYEATAYAVVTNKTPLGTMRGPGEVESTFARERMIDLLAERLDMDPRAFRLKNLIGANALPYTLELGEGVPYPLLYESGDYHQQLNGALDEIDYEQLRADAAAARSRGELVGVGMACGHNASAIGHFEWGRVVAEPDGSFTGYVGVSGLGQGVQTALAQVLADALGVPMELVRIHYHDTDAVPDGEGAYADRATIFGAGALMLAVDDLKEDARRKGAAALGVPEGEVIVEGAEVTRAGTDADSIPLSELGCSGRGKYEKHVPDYDFCASVAYVAVDRSTGKVTVRRYVGAYDVGHAVNPLIVEGQLDGAAAQGIAGVLFEESPYDEDGQPLAGSFMDYVMPTCAELPAVESLIYEFPSQSNPLGIKGAGNPGIITTHGAIANAVADALGPAGRKLTSLPLRPGRVRELLRAEENGPIESLATAEAEG
jgi:carbon-monoxide dehydrogenase large subunit